MSVEGNKTRVRQIYEAISKGDLMALDHLLTADFVDHNPDPGQVPGLEGVKQGFTMFRTAFPDFQITLEDMIAEGDKVATRVTGRGTHKGEFQGISPTGKQVTVTGIDIIRCAGGKCVERWGAFDNLGMMQQLGVVPPSG